MEVVIDSIIEVLRRIADRGLSQAVSQKDNHIDLWQHMLDEIQRLGNNYTVIHNSNVDRVRRVLGC